MSLWLVLVLAAAPAPAPKLAITPFSTVDLPESRGQLFAEHLGTRLIENGLQVTTPKDMAIVLGFERQRQLLGCSSGVECLVELAGALGVTELITGEVAKLDSGYQLVVKVLAAGSGSVRFARTTRVDTERELFSTLDAWALTIAGKAAPRSWAPVIPVVTGAVAAGFGAGFLVSASFRLASLQRRGVDALTYEDALAAKTLGARDQWLGAVLAGAGALAIGAGLAWLALSTPPTQASAVWVVPSLHGFALVGVWP